MQVMHSSLFVPNPIIMIFFLQIMLNNELDICTSSYLVRNVTVVESINNALPIYWLTDHLTSVRLITKLFNISDRRLDNLGPR